MPKHIASLIDYLARLQRNRIMPPYQADDPGDENLRTVLLTGDAILIIEPTAATITAT